MMKRLILLVTIIGMMFLCLTGREDPAKLVKEAGGPSDFPHASHIKVFDKTHVKVMDTGLSHVNKETLYKVLNTRGALSLKSLVFGYDPQSAFVEVKEAKIIKKDGTVKEISPKTVKDYPAPQNSIFWGAREILLPVGRLEPGDGLWVKTYQKGFTYALLYGGEEDDDRYIPPMKGHFYDIVPFYENLPVLVKSYEISVPSNKPLQYEFYNGEARHWVHFNGERTDYFWEKKKIMPMKREDRMVNPSDVAPKLLLSTAKNWEAKSLWFHSVNEDFGSFEYNAELKKKTDQIIAGSRDDWDKISRLTHWVAEEIRYWGLTMGEGEGFTLHKSDMTFLDRCGVCKDKAGILIAMLRAAGFESHPAMTMAGSRIDRIPADQFNHCVTLVKVEGKYHLLDPTWVPGVRELWSSAEQQQEYLMGIPGGADLKSTPISPPEKHFFQFDIRSRIDAAGSLEATVEITAEGQSDAQFRRGFRRNPRAAWNGLLMEQFNDIHPDVKISNLKYQDPYDISKPMKLTFKAVFPNSLPPAGDKGETVVAPFSAHLPFQPLLFFNRIRNYSPKRLYPFRIRSSQQIKVKERLELPPGYRLVPPEKSKNPDGAGASFKGSIRQKGKTLFIEKELKLKKRVYEAADWPGFRECVLEFRKPGGGVLILERSRRK